MRSRHPASPTPSSVARRAGRLVAAVALSGLVLAACGGTLRGATPATFGNAVGQHDLLPGPSYEVTTRTIPNLGSVLVTGQGLTLYLFVPDHRSVPTCYQICAVQWPPDLLPPGVSHPVAGPGISPKLLSTVARANGSRQVTYNGWPLYRWLPDTAPGQATGQGLFNLGGQWWVLDPAGRAVTH
ncbi:MAG: hypothetical protein M0029_05580 [Actinomycetota bacterium]|jgi:predicted lipoprotein with Yx(FWY)xxD motif|nr:hypothetical protein [Actinomycetota bacterium]